MHNSRVKRWGPFLLVLIAAAAILGLHSRSASLLQDSDTQVLLTRIVERGDALSWFRTDWPLENHFYRPVSTLSFVLDHALFGSNAVGYGWSAALYCALCVLALYWFARELSARPALAACAALVFALWHSPTVLSWEWFFSGLMVVAAIVGVIRHGAAIRYYLPAVLALGFIAVELNGVHIREAPSGLYRGVLMWLPARTATLSTLLVLVSLASYARYERRRGPRKPRPSAATDLPATRTSRQESVPTGWAPLWAALSMLALVLAVGSYEQAFMLPSLLLCVTFYLHRDGYDVKWGFPVAAFALAGAMLLVRYQVVPHGLSAYQLQQARSGPTAWLAILEYGFPALASLPLWASGFGIGPAFAASPQFYSFPWLVGGNLTAYIEAARSCKLAVCGWFLSLLSFLPMAFLKPFPHYHYLSMALRSIFVVALLDIVWRLCVSAASPPVLQAPPRPSPAPGSLPRP